MEYSPQDELLIEAKWQELQEVCRKANTCRREDDWELIKRAFFLAKEAHKGVRRRSGEPYIIHPLEVAIIVVREIGLGKKSVVSALLHDVVEDTEYTVDDIARMFTPKIASMVDGLTKMAGVFNTDTSEQAEYFRKVLLTLSDDVRVIIIKIADRLHNMRTLGAMPHNKQIKITSETIYLFVPLAYRLGLHAIKSELEDLCMKYRFPEEYEEIKRKIDTTEPERQQYIDKFTAPIIEVLDCNGIQYEMSARVKSIYSIWNKMRRKDIPFEEVYDLFAIRIVFKALPFPSEKTQCWQIYSNITDIYTPKPDRLRDWISIPKSNGYEALHSTVMGPDGIWVEVQVRTERMDDIAERGFAAHWKYKHASISQEEDGLDKWLKKVRDALSSPTESALEFLDNFKLSLYKTDIVVFTPKGEPHNLPYGASVLDFAYEIHTKIGNRAIGAKINHKIASVGTKLNSGDQVEVITAESAHPKAEWLEMVSTSKARQAIQSFLKRENQNNIESGMELLQSRLAEYNVTLSGRVLRKLMPAYECRNKDELYSKIGAGIISLDNLDKLLKENSSRKILKFWKLFIPGSSNAPKDDDQDIDLDDEAASLGDTAVEDLQSGNEPEFVMAECCEPIPGDKVVGYRDPQSGRIIVHKSTCDELIRLASQFGDNIVKEEIKWSQQRALSYLATVEIRGIDRSGIVLDLTKMITLDFSINMRAISVQSHDGIFEGTISLYVQDIESLNTLLDNIRRIKGMESVKRLLNT
ncbi:MAG: bifunctional (p)ppGpp synthetase/guanosine-3',5'-bis(diphosphate) 3'-pyrophosphohydrolase [Alistipes sp.]|nr:bifunctional (p)ppGpp synthetase/guanosine-3',5'-bis(diphosphate) 3'-pyrophosphohydrolase [Alistipes sp.]